METDGDREQWRRALNMIWTAAEDYSFRPVFMAFDRDGRADIYLNSIIGWAHRRFRGQGLEKLAASFEGTAYQELYDTVYWLCIENCVYGMECKNRPAASCLRREYARAIMEEADKSREQSLALTLRNAHFGKVLGIKAVLLPWEQKVLHAMELEGDLTEDEVEQRIRFILQEYFHFRFPGEMDPQPDKKHKRIRPHIPFLRKRTVRYMVTRLENPEDPEEDGDSKDAQEQGTGRREDAGQKNKKGPKDGADLQGWLGDFLGELREAGRTEWTREYIEICFGKPLYNERELQGIESRLCMGNHRDCHVYFTEGLTGPRTDKIKAAGRMAEESMRRQKAALEQEKKNREYYEARRDVHRNCILRLKEQIANTLFIEQEPEQIIARMGKLDGTRVWRGPYLEDNRVFTRDVRNDLSPFSVDIMLDSSASQLHRQEMIASQGYIMAESLRLCGIPTQIYSFCSFYGYTVFTMFRGYGDRETNRSIFRYAACGWNRDGLALRGAGYLMEQSPCSRRLLIILTDASPNDDRKMPSEERGFRKTGYESQAGIQDAAYEVRKLRKKGVRVIGVFYGLDQELDGAKKIYGSSFARIKDPRQLADTVGGLIRKEVIQNGMS